MSTSIDASKQDSTSDNNPLYYYLSAGVRQRVDTLLLAESSRRTSSTSQQQQQRGGGGLNELVPPPPLNTASTPAPSPEPWPPSCLPDTNPHPNQSGGGPNSLSRRRHTTFVDVPTEEGSCGGSEMSRRRHYHHHPHTIPGVFHRVGWGGIPVGLLAGSGVSSGAGGGVNQIQRRVSRDGAEFENVGGGGSQPPLHSTNTTPSAQRHHHNQNSSTKSTEELKLQIHQLEYKIRLGLEREQHWMSENQLLRDELNNNRLEGTNNTGYAGDDNDDDIRSNDSQSTIAATTTVRRPPPRENADDNDGADDGAAAAAAAPVNPKLLLLHIQADEAAYRSRIEVESMSRLWGEGGSGGGGGGGGTSSSSSPTSIWTTFLVESHRASLHTHRSAALQLESVSAQLRIATESNILKTKENCILLDQLKQMQQYHERERKAFRDKLLDVVQSIAGSTTVISATSSPPPTSE